MKYAKLFAAPLFINPAFVDICGGDGTSGMLLDHLYGACLDGPTAITYAELRASIYLSEKALNRARGKLKAFGYLEESRKDIPQKLFYKINYFAVEQEIDRWLESENYVAHAINTKETP
jgi:hypothetical protein